MMCFIAELEATSISSRPEQFSCLTCNSLLTTVSNLPNGLIYLIINMTDDYKLLN